MGNGILAFFSELAGVPKKLSISDIDCANEPLFVFDGKNAFR